ncbi:MAG: hypothetical protein MUF38_14480, partial [Anaerolineae bacterium]|nr:hypothetical protein [Anaerolineae bacterium]
MGFWGWRQGACAAFISVLVVACVPTPQTLPPTAPAFTALPVTLTVVKPPGSSSRTPNAPRILTATPAPARANLDIAPAACRELLAGGVQCLGLISNPSDDPVAAVRLEAQWLSTDGTSVYSVGVEQWVILPGLAAPYRLFIAAPIDVVVVSASSDLNGGDGRWVVLPIEEQLSGLTDDGRYWVAAQVVNPTDASVEGGRAVVSLFDGDMLLGYR